MTDSTTTPVLAAGPRSSGAIEPARPSPDRLVQIGSRLGVWGLVGGFGVMTAGTLGAPISLGAAIAVMGAGLLASGLGTMTASAGVLRRFDRAPVLIRASALAGIPLGGALAVLGVTSLSLWTPLIAIVNAVTVVAGALGVVVVVLLVLGFFLGLRDEADAE